MQHNGDFFNQLKFYNTFAMRRASIFSGNNTMMVYFDIIIFIGFLHIQHLVEFLKFSYSFLVITRVY